MRIAVLVKQIPAPVELRLEAGRLVRDGVPLEVNAYCRRANAKAVELAGADGEVVVFTMGPPSAADALREMIACGADRGVHLCDPVFAGSDTLATAVALAAAVRREGPFDLMLAGLNSLDSDTGQVPAAVAEFLGLPFAAGVRELDLDDGSFEARLETDDGYCTIEGELPVALSTAERLCAPSKAPPEVYAAVSAHRIVQLAATDLDVPITQLGAAGSPTSVGAVRMLGSARQALRVSSPAEAVDLLEELGAFTQDEVTRDNTSKHSTGSDSWAEAPPSAVLLGSGVDEDDLGAPGVDRAQAVRFGQTRDGIDASGVYAAPTAVVRQGSGVEHCSGVPVVGVAPAGVEGQDSGVGEGDLRAPEVGAASGVVRQGSGVEHSSGAPGVGAASGVVRQGSGVDGAVWGVRQRSVWCFFTDPGVGIELISEAAELAAWISGTVTAVTNITDKVDRDGLAAAGADRLLIIPSATEPSEQADALSAAVAASLPWVLLVEGTRSGRVVAAIVAARNGWGLTGDAVGLEVGPDGRLVAWKPAFGGRLLVPILSRSPVQMVTIRAGVLARRSPRDGGPDLVPEVLPAPVQSRLRTVSVVREDDDMGELRRARTVVAVGVGVQPAGYPMIDALRAALGNAALGATRRVTDQGWVSRGRQIGVTGHAVSPRLLVAVGSSGRFNHTVGIRNAGTILAINSDPDAEIFDQADIGLVGDWQQIVPELTAELQSRALSY